MYFVSRVFELSGLSHFAALMRNVSANAYLRNPLARAFRMGRHFLLQVKGRIIFGRKVGILGNFTVINPANVTIGAGCGINHEVFILGANKIEIGSNVVLSARCMLIDSGLELRGFAATEFPAHTSSFIRIEDGAWIGAAAIILPGVVVGRKSVVGAGSVVTKEVAAFTIVAGNPARVVGRTDE